MFFPTYFHLKSLMVEWTRAPKVSLHVFPTFGVYQKSLMVEWTRAPKVRLHVFPTCFI